MQRYSAAERHKHTTEWVALDPDPNNFSDSYRD